MTTPDRNESTELAKAELENLRLANTDPIVKEAAKVAHREHIYDIRVDGKQKVGLTHDGVEEACRLYAKQFEFIRVIDHPKIQADPHEPENFIVVTVLAQRFVNLKGNEIPCDSEIGSKRQEKFHKQSKDDKAANKPKKFNPDYVDHAITKASRNARSKLLSIVVKKALIRAAWERKNAEDKRPSAKKPPQRPPQQPQQPPAKPPKRQRAKLAESSELNDIRVNVYTEVKRLVGTDQQAMNEFTKSLLPGIKSTADVPKPDLIRLYNDLFDAAENKAKWPNIFDVTKGVIIRRKDKAQLWPAPKKAEPQPASAEGTDNLF